MFEIKLLKKHSGPTFTFERVIAKSVENSGAPLIKALIEAMLFTGNSTVKVLIDFAASGIKTAVADHFKVLLRDMSY